MPQITVIASFNMDLVMRAGRQPHRGETLQGAFAMYLGGKGFNQAIAARRLGADVAVLGRVGNDEFGAAFLAALDREGIDRSQVVVDSREGTGVAAITVLPDGENAIIQAPRANLCLDAGDLSAADRLTSADCVMATLETPAAVAEQAQALVRGNTRFMLNVAPATRLDRLRRDGWDVVTANTLEAEAFTGIRIDTPAAAAEAGALAVRRDGIRAIAITLGADGAIVVSEGRREHVRGYAVHAVDTTGAGDAFCAGLALRLAEGAELVEAVRFGCAAGALACTRAGAEPSMPARADVEALASSTT